MALDKRPSPPLPESRIREWTTKAGVKRKKREYRVVCACGAVRWIFKEDIPRSKQCQRCQWRERGKKGWEKTEAKLSHKYGGLTGRALWVEMSRQRCENKPMPTELVMSDLLVGIPYERNFVLDFGDHSWIVDFLLYGRIVLEVNGGIHKLKEHQQRDSRKYSELLTLGYTVLVLDDDEAFLNPKADEALDYSAWYKWLWKSLM